MSQWFQRQRISGDPIIVGDTTVTPQAQSVTLRWPYGGLIWNRPSAIVVERDNHTTPMHVIDITRVLVWGLLGLGLFFAIVTALLSNQQRRKKNE